jgi:hypothetical protein
LDSNIQAGGDTVTDAVLQTAVETAMQDQM